MEDLDEDEVVHSSLESLQTSTLDEKEWKNEEEMSIGFALHFTWAGISLSESPH